MNNNLLKKFATAIRNFDGNAQSTALRIASEGRLTVQYAPFEWVNTQAKIVIIGITPGETQAVNALSEAQRQMRNGASDAEVMMAAKQVGAFSGALRSNLVAMLDDVGVPRWAGISSSADLFGPKAHLLQTASVLPNPVFIDGKRYNGNPSLLRSPMLRSMVLDQFVPSIQAIPKAKLLAVGDVPWETLQWLVEKGVIGSDRLLGNLPHPSGANNERISYFLGKKTASDTSVKTDTGKLDQMRVQLKQALA